MNFLACLFVLAFLATKSEAISWKPMTNATFFIDYYGATQIPSQCKPLPPYYTTLECSFSGDEPFYFIVNSTTSMILLSFDNKVNAARASHATIVGPGTYRLVLDRYGEIFTGRSFGWQPSIDNTSLVLELVLGYDFF
jgi:hypothetical protein